MTLYLDTSVFGGYFEIEFKPWSEKLVHSILDGEHLAVVSDITLEELEGAPQYVQELAQKIINENADFVVADEQARDLAQKYIDEKIVTRKFQSDALHIAMATIHKIDVLASWNFKHIVNLNRIRLYNSVNLKYGYSIIEIRSPRELVTI